MFSRVFAAGLCYHHIADSHSTPPSQSSLLIRFWATKILELRALLQNDKIRCGGGAGRDNKCFYMLFTISAEILAFMGKHKK